MNLGEIKKPTQHGFSSDGYNFPVVKLVIVLLSMLNGRALKPGILGLILGN